MIRRREHFDFERRLNAYTLAAAAAGVSALALAQPAEGKIIYTKAHKNFGPNQTLHLDLNHDKIADFDLKDTFTTSTAGGAFGTLSAVPKRPQNAIWGHTVPLRAYASALPANVQIGPKKRFLPAGGFMAASSYSGLNPGNFSCTGPWADVTNRYLGLKFAIKGERHFGWARLNVSCSNATVNGTLTGYAYESVANKPILTGKTHGTDGRTSAALAATLGGLAQGVRGRNDH